MALNILKLFNKKEVEAIQISVPNNKLTKNFFEFDHKYDYRITATTKKWRDSLSYAEDWESPNRSELLKLYKELILDATIQNAVDLRTQRLLSVPFSIVNKTDKVNEKSQKIFESYWFEKYLKFAMESVFYGHSLIQIDGIVNGNVSDVTLIPRENVVPEFGTFKKNAYVQATDSTDYMKPKVYKWLCEVYHTRRYLGLLNATAPYQIAKKTAMVAWSQFVEVFGLPMVIGRTNSNIESEKLSLQKFLQDLSINSRAVLDKQTELEFKETTRSDVYQVYKELMTAMNNELNSLILGGTELTSGGSGGSEARATVHQAQSNYKTAADLRYIKNNINSVLIPKLQALKVLPKGIEFKFNTDELLTMAERIEIDKVILSKYNLSKDYIERVYKVELAEDEPVIDQMEDAVKDDENK